MKIEYKNDLEIESVGDDDSVEAGIDDASLPFLFEMMSNSLYSNKIGSLIREVTSNCVDAHIEAGVDEAVVLKKVYDFESECYFIHFIDQGVGMSPDRVMKVYMNYFSSTKRETNSLIGGFGLGSKSPLSYQDMFYITTVFNGLEYEYIYYKGVKKPTIDSIHGFERFETLETVLKKDENGEQVFDEEGKEVYVERPIKVKIPIGVPTTKRNGTTIKIEIKEGDEYDFETEIKKQLCYFDNVYFQNFTTLSNDYTIYEGKHYKFRSDNKGYSDMHIVLDKVTYPIDFKALEMSVVNIPVSIKFKTGELEMTPNRETLRYSKEIKELITQRIQATIKEIVTKYNKENPVIEDIFEYLDKKDERPHINFKNEREEVHKLYIPVEYTKANSKNFRGLEMYIPNNPFFMFRNMGQLNGEEVVDRGYNTSSIKNMIRRRDEIYLVSGPVSKYKNAFISDGGLIISSIYLIKEHKLDYKTLCQTLGLDKFDPQTGKKKPLQLGNAVKIKKYLDYIRSVVYAKTKRYEGVYVSDQWIQEYKLKKKQETAAYQRKINQKILVRTTTGHRKEFYISDLARRKAVIYKIKGEDNINLYELKTFIQSRKSLNNIESKFKILFIEVAKTNFKYIKDLDNIVHAKDIPRHKMFDRLFRDFYTAALIHEKQHLFNLDIELLQVSTYYYSKKAKLLDFVYRHYNGQVDFKLEDLKKICELKGLRNNEIEQDLKELIEFYNKTDILKYVAWRTPERHLKTICSKLKVTKLNQNLYSINN